jgi:hypothetical protein
LIGGKNLGRRAKALCRTTWVEALKCAALNNDSAQLIWASCFEKV